MIYNLTTVDVAIGKVIRDLDIGDREVPWMDFVEWIAEALKHIGSYYQFTEKEAIIDIEDFRGELPCDLVKVKRITAGGEYLVNNQFLPSDGNIQKNKITNRDLNITHNNLTVSFRCGKLAIQYLAMPLDKDGFPLIPDDPSFMDALFWKVCYMLGLRGFEFKNTQLRDINFTSMKWNRYCMQARASANMPDPDMQERLKNNFLRLKTDQNQYLKRFTTNGMQESLTLKGRSIWPSY